MTGRLLAPQRLHIDGAWETANRLLFGIGTFDAVTLIGASLVLGLAAWLAAYLPARRATRANPLAALRAD